MRARLRLNPPARWLIEFGAVVAIAAQLSVALAPLGEARYGRSTAAHVEPGGTATHYAHNDATCAVCQARLLQGFVPKASELPLALTVRTRASVAPVDRFVAFEAHSPSKPRAPPVG